MRLESAEEGDFFKWAKKQGYQCLKIQCVKSWPDRLLLCPDEICMFIEFKRPGEIPTKLQTYNHNVLRKLGYLVFVVFDKNEAKEIVHCVIRGRKETSEIVLPGKQKKHTKKSKKVRG